MSAAVPPPLHTSEPGSFARDTLARRVPEILAGTRARLGPIPPEAAAALTALDEELRAGVLRGLVEEAPDRAAWDEEVAPFLGKSWLDLPWYFAESFFYRRLLEATGYFGAGALAGRDPFAPHKAEEWAPLEGPRRCAELLGTLPAGPADRLRALLLGSLWGNRADLSYNVARELGAFIGAPSDLLVDDSRAVVDFIAARAPARVVIIADNAGTEALMDLALVAHLLGPAGVGQVDLHLKDHPFFVSDTIAADVDAAVRALIGSGHPLTTALGQEIQGLRAGGRLALWSHPFYTSSRHYPQLPADLRRVLAAADLVILKGDANYRRLCSDAHWPPETPFADVVTGFPAPLVALRTLKAEVVVGLPPGMAGRLAAEDARWLVNGRRGLVQARLSAG
jgi:hypothetical protein